MHAQRRERTLRFPAVTGDGPTSLTWLDRLPVLYFLIFAALVLLHWPLLRLPYFWDEAGYYIPAARDLLLHGSLIPTSTLTNAHPPLLMAWLALWWKVFGYSALVTRLAMLTVASATLIAVFRLARAVMNRSVAYAAIICTALYPVFFAQSSLAHLDMAAAGFTLWGVGSYLRDRRWEAALFFSLASLAKETAIIAPAALIVWELLCRWFARTRHGALCALPRSNDRILWLLTSAAPLAIWFAYHYRNTGFVFGNPEFLTYNLSSTLHPVRFLIAFADRVWQLLAYMNLFVLAAAAALAIWRPPLSDARNAIERVRGKRGGAIERAPIPLGVQLIFAVLILAYAVAMSLVGGALLARYLLPVYPLVTLIFVSTLWRRVPWWQAFVAVVCLGFVLGLFVNPPYHFAPEDNLAYTDFIRLHQSAARYVQQHEAGRVLTAWPASDELTKPYLGYVSAVVPIVRIDNFSPAQILAARDVSNTFDTALVFSTKYEPGNTLLFRVPLWEEVQKRYFGYHRDLPAAAIADLLGGKMVFQQRRGGQWVAVIELERVVNARSRW